VKTECLLFIFLSCGKHEICNGHGHFRSVRPAFCNYCCL